MARYLRKVTDNSITVVADDDDQTLHTLLSQVTSGADVPAHSSPKPLYEETSEAWVLQHGGSSSHPAQSGSGVTAHDLGTVNIVDLLDGPQTLYTPTGPAWVVKVAVARATLVLPDSHSLKVVQGSPPFAADPDTPLFLVNTASAVPSPVLTGWMQDKPIIVGINTGYSGYFLDEAPGSWQANATYDTDKECILESGHIWSSSVGTTDSSKPDFAGSPTLGSTVTDNTVTWTNEGALPTTGSAHLYALVL